MILKPRSFSSSPPHRGPAAVLWSECGGPRVSGLMALAFGGVFLAAACGPTANPGNGLDAQGEPDSTLIWAPGNDAGSLGTLDDTGGVVPQSDAGGHGYAPDGGGSDVAYTFCTPGEPRSCTVGHGTGQQTCDAAGLAWSTCKAIACDDGFALSGNTCVVRAPVISWHTSEDGAQTLSYYNDSTAYGKVIYSSRDAENCVEVVGVSDGFCATATWNTPGPLWGWDQVDRVWRITTDGKDYAYGKFRHFWRDKQSGLEATPVVVEVKPVHPVSSWHVSLDGPKAYSFLNDAPAYGKVMYSSTNAKTCGESVGIDDGRCNDDANWAAPGSEWTYDTVKHVWRTMTADYNHKYAPRRYRHFWKDLTSGFKSAPIIVEVKAVPPVLTWHSSVDGPEKYVFVTSDTGYARVRYSGGNAKACSERVGVNDGHCDDVNNAAAWAPPAPPWSFDQIERAWRIAIGGAPFEPGQYRHFWFDVETGLKSRAVIVELK